MPNPEITQSPLDRRAVELYENVTLLEVQVESATSHLKGKKKALKDLPAANDRRGKVCTFCHISDHNRIDSKKTPCNDVNSCKLKDKQPELLTEIRTLQRELKELEQKYAKVKSDHELFTASRQRAKSSFFTSKRPRLRGQNPMKYINRSPLGRNLMSLQRALRNKVPLKKIA